MEIFSLIFLGLLSIRLAYQDFRSRTVDIVGLVLFLAGAVLLQFFIRPIDLISLSLNLGFLVTLFLLATVISKVIYKKNITAMIGMGDVVYLLISALYFEFPTFIIWFNASIIIALISHVLLVKIFNPKGEYRKLIPLLGYFSIVFFITLVYETYGGSLGSVIS